MTDLGAGAADGGMVVRATTHETRRRTADVRAVLKQGLVFGSGVIAPHAQTVRGGAQARGGALLTVLDAALESLGVGGLLHVMAPFAVGTPPARLARAGPVVVVWCLEEACPRYVGHP